MSSKPLLDIDLIHAFCGAAFAAVGALAGYMLGVVLYIVMLASSAFSNSNAIVVVANNAGGFPILFAMTLAAIGFFSGFVISRSNATQAAKTATS